LDWVKPHDLPVISSRRTQIAIALTVELEMADFRWWDDGAELMHKIVAGVTGRGWARLGL